MLLVCCRASPTRRLIITEMSVCGRHSNYREARSDNHRSVSLCVDFVSCKHGPSWPLETENSPLAIGSYQPLRLQLISSSMSRHLSTRNILSKYMYAFLSNLANRQANRQTDKQQTNTGKTTCTSSSFVGGKLCLRLV